MKENINIIRAILILLLLIMFGVIFNFSNQNGEKSGSLSKKVTNEITKKIIFLEKLEESEKEKILSKIEHYIRKMAHFSLYLIVGVLTMSLSNTYDWKILQKVGISLIIDISYAMADEIHQIFIPGRTASVLDVGIDSLGAFVGILIILIIIKKVKMPYIMKKTK